ncbi:ATP-grasp domain-containing protein [Ruania alba]|uniref:Glutathione synthase/RimK-type ligase, ATP-grasp superfamily n=1 Tax=Ruania alba TaxID=648782 RepID=A0A1H5DE27_9MICO|nr:hypothetical protein [Ruania alba]SED77173.1 Glutathione synthase/RimK-type ligase, ATP-grasp superfamily [Ruania alba]
MTTTPDAGARLALVTCSDLPDLDPEDAPLIGALAEREVAADVVVWDDPEVDWSVYDLVVLRSVWDYTSQRKKFLRWAGSVPRLVNPPNVVRWNIDKHYLQALEDHGLPVVQTTWLEPHHGYDKRGLHNRFPAREDFVIKPAVAAGSEGAGRYTATNANSRRYAIEHAKRLIDDGHSVMVQRYMPEVDSHGEIALVFFHGTFSHAMRKGAMLTGIDDPNAFQVEEMEAYKATHAEIEAAQQALAFARARIPGRNISSRPLPYARVDLIPSGRTPVVMELELVDPALHCTLGRDAMARFADSLAAEIRMGPDSNNIDLA